MRWSIPEQSLHCERHSTVELIPRSWDNYYQHDLDNDEDNSEKPPPELSELESWFDDVDAPAKTLEFLTSESFPLSPRSSNPPRAPASVLDLGTGNGSALFALRLEGGYTGDMVGVDYSPQSIDLARRLWRQYAALPISEEMSRHGDGLAQTPADIRFEVLDLIRDSPQSQSWWPQDKAGFDLVLDKGTFDAISLSSETMTDGATGREGRICEVYPRKVAELVAPGGYLLITSCNWTEEEVIRWFTKGDSVQGLLHFFDSIKYPVFEFGGQKGQGVASVCFRRERD